MLMRRVAVVCGVLAVACTVARTDEKPVNKAPAPRVVPQKYEMQFKNAPWGDVLDWYAKETGLTLITTVEPTGKFTFEPPVGVRYTLGEVTDLLNDAMAPQKFILIRRHLTFLIQPSDEKIDPRLLPQVAVAELPERGRTEIVEVIIPVMGPSAEEVASELKKLLTPFGAIKTDRDGRVVVRDTAGNVLRIKKVLDTLFEQKPQKK